MPTDCRRKPSSPASSIRISRSEVVVGDGVQLCGGVRDVDGWTGAGRAARCSAAEMQHEVDRDARRGVGRSAVEQRQVSGNQSQTGELCPITDR